jgi:hypothetical protein
VEDLPSLTPTVTDVELLEDGPIGLGSRARIKQPAQRAKVWTVTEFDAPNRFVWTTRSFGANVAGIHELTGDDTRTTNTLAVEITGPLAPLLGRLLRPTMRKVLATENRGFKRVAEESSQRAPGAANEVA